MKTTFLDMILIIAISLIAMLFIVLPFLNDPTVEDSTKAPGTIQVYVFWEDGDIDLDLWVLGPRSSKPVSYQNKATPGMNLLRDDLGDPDRNVNFEHVFTRGLEAGEYVVNLHAYNLGGVDQVEATVEVRRHGNGYNTTIYRGPVTMTQTGEEQTVVRFQIGETGHFVPGSSHNLYKDLRPNKDTRS